MYFSENKIFEQAYPSSGCIFLPLGLAMSGLLCILLWIALSAGAVSEFIRLVPILILLGALVYFCFSRCRARVAFGIYPEYITIDNKSFPWIDIQNIIFEKENKNYLIKVNLNKRHIKKYIVISILLVIVCVVIGIQIGVDKAIFLFIMFEAMFAIKITKPGTKMTGIQAQDFETVFSYTKYYAQMYDIPVEYENDEEKDNKIIM